jgi:hypothetical protein
LPPKFILSSLCTRAWLHSCVPMLDYSFLAAESLLAPAGFFISSAARPISCDLFSGGVWCLLVCLLIPQAGNLLPFFFGQVGLTSTVLHLCCRWRVCVPVPVSAVEFLFKSSDFYVNRCREMSV